MADRPVQASWWLKRPSCDFKNSFSIRFLHINKANYIFSMDVLFFYHFWPQFSHGVKSITELAHSRYFDWKIIPVCKVSTSFESFNQFQSESLRTEVARCVIVNSWNYLFCFTDDQVQITDILFNHNWTSENVDIKPI